MQSLNTLAAMYEISCTQSVLFNMTYELTCTSHNCGQRLPNVHINFNAASYYTGAALYQICARLINCIAFNMLNKLN